MKTDTNVFNTEHKRHGYAKEGRKKLLLQTYETPSQLDDLNTSNFWDNRIKQKEINNFMSRERVEYVHSLIRGKKGRFLDIGFGKAVLVKSLQKEKDLDIFGIDISDYAVKKARKSFKGEFKKASIFNIPCKDNFFDYVSVLEVLEHIQPLKIFKALKEIKRVIKKGGILVVSVPLNEGLEDMIKRGENPNGHLRIYTPDLIETELLIAGFKVKERKFLYAFEKLYNVKKILQKTILRKRWKPNNIILVAHK